MSDHKAVTYDQLADDLSLDRNNIAKYIKKLQKERCLIVEKEYTDKGYECNKYHITSPQFFEEKSKDNGTPFNEQNVELVNVDSDVEYINETEKENTLNIKLLA